MTVKELAEFLNVTAATLYRLKKRNKGPKYIELESGSIRYDREEIKRWLEAKEVGLPNEKAE